MIMVYADFMRYVSIVAMIAFLDILTFVKVRISTVKVSINDTVARQRRHDEINFVKQVCLQGVVFVCELLTYFIIVGYYDSRWARFLLTTFSWALVHACDGFITLFFNKGFFRAVRASLCGSRRKGISDTYDHQRYPDTPNTKPSETQNTT